MGEVPKVVFGTGIKQQVAVRIRGYIAKNFGSDSAAAKDLKISRQRLFSYTSATSLPRPDVFDLILQQWGLNLWDKPIRRDTGNLIASVPFQPALFDKPITLRSEGMKVVIKRKGARVIANIEISTDVQIA